MSTTKYGLPNDYFRYFGWYSRSDQPVDEPTYDPGLQVGCPFCDEALTADNVRTVSVMALGGVESYFYRVHRACDDRASKLGVGDQFEDRLLGVIPPDDRSG